MAKRPRTGTATKVQTTRAAAPIALNPNLAALLGVFSAQSNVAGLKAPPPATYETYRQMRCNPTVAIARAALFAPIKAAAWSYEAADGVPDDRVKFVQGQMDGLRSQLLTDALRSLEYGWQPFERVWAIRDRMIGYARAKPLLPDCTSVIVDPESGMVIGVRNGDATLYTDKAAVITYDAEGDDPYGRSIYENIREHAWWPWNDAARKLAQYMTKGAGVIPIVRYPMGTGIGENGQPQTNDEGAAALLRALSNGLGVAMPTVLEPSLEPLLREGANVESLMAWQISFLETRSGVGNEIIESMRHYEKLMVRGMLQPERAILEGQSGTRADAGSHADLALTMAIDLLAWMTGRINALFVDPLLSVNFGTEARGTVWIEPAPIRDDDREFLRNLMASVLNANPDLLLAVADFDAMLDTVGLPKSAEVVDVATATGGTPAAPPVGQGGGGPPLAMPQPQPGVLASLARAVRGFRAMGLS